MKTSGVLRTNGAGKTTASYNVLPEKLNCKEFVNADEIARGLSPFQPEKVAVQAGRIMLKRIDELIALKENFAIETTLATRSYRSLIQEAQNVGYEVTLLFFWLNSVDLAIDRVQLRVEKGGHHIPKDVIQRRYKSGIKNLINIFIPICDSWIVMNNSDKFFFISEKYDPEINIIFREDEWNIITKIAHEKD
ncbi:zeta toxin family protein [Ferruginibacter sp. HRS2-29]|uniref:zeta toxin family protein n=1 Tax=Ferruginibacter sp. HRS2-29 TaxID=2487334 RepID=UPI0020CD556C|nr:zeta toxin family protein [Ferruginibacter sp. HRS2-29]MCP9753213.1 zeta toxin [Ferruginibacter sp. HRS2-29]